MSSFWGPFSGTGGGGGGGGGPLRAAVLLANGANNNLNPGGGWPINYGRLVLTSAAAANVTGLVAGLDGQGVTITNNNASGGANITLNQSNAGSTATNQFDYTFDLVLTPGASVTVVYDATIGKWLIT